MFSVVDCITTQHDLTLVALAALVCGLSVFTAFRFMWRISTVHGAWRWVWAAATGVIAGGGVWATHFVAMLAYAPELPLRFELDRTMNSLVLAVLGMTGAFAAAALIKPRWSSLVAGIGAGLSISAMHYTGIAALHAVFNLQWRVDYIAASIAISVTASTLAFWSMRNATGLSRLFAPTTALCVAIVGLHFTGMTALTLIPDLVSPVTPEIIDRRSLAVTVGGVATILIAFSGVAAFADARARREGLNALEVAFKGLPSGLAVYDARGAMILWNPAYVDLVRPFGVKPFMGMTRADIAVQLQKAGALSDADGREYEWVAQARSQKVGEAPQEWRLPGDRWLQSQVSPLARGAGMISVLTDITVLKRAAETMAEARDRAEAASRAKSEFLANMSHEIRTPLNGVLGMAQAMEADELSPAQRGRLSIVRESGASLLTILNDILDLSKIQAGKFELVAAPFDLTALLEMTCAAFQSAAADKGLGLSLQVEAPARGRWVGDAPRIRQIVANLISNALKFTQKGKVAIIAWADDHGVWVEIHDTGIGIAQEHLPQLFEKFSQVDASATRRFGGTGLGLSISRDLARLMEGEITVESRLGEGSRFLLRLPLERPSIEAEQTSQQTSEAAGAVIERPLAILAAEDNPTNQIVLRSLLQPLDVDLTLVSNGRAAVDAYAAGEFDIVLMDIQMPEMNGVEATLAIRQLEIRAGRTPTPIYALSANVMTHQVEEYLAAGMNGYLAKPIEVAKLYQTLEDAAFGVERQEAA